MHTRALFGSSLIKVFSNVFYQMHHFIFLSLGIEYYKIKIQNHKPNSVQWKKAPEQGSSLCRKVRMNGGLHFSKITMAIFLLNL